jgi:hypothetical protein
MAIPRSTTVRHVLVAGVLALAAATASVLHTPSAQARTTASVGTKDALSGVGYADRDEWANWRGRPVDVSETWNDAKDSSGKLDWGDMNALYTVHEYYSDGKWGGALSLAQPMYAQDENVNGCATTDEISTWANALKDAWPRADAFIRLGWEFNGDWYTWKQNPGDAAAFKSCWIRWHDTLKAASPDFKLVWNPNNQSSNGSLDVRSFWPGKEYVDAAGPDAYALSENGSLIDVNKKGPNGEPLGINAWVDWVAQQGVPFASPEWAIRDQTWGSTDPEYLTQMRTAFQKAASSSTGLAYESYFDGSTAFSCQFSIHDADCGYDKHPDAANRYKSLWSSPYSTS